VKPVVLYSCCNVYVDREKRDQSVTLACQVYRVFRETWEEPEIKELREILKFQSQL